MLLGSLTRLTITTELMNQPSLYFEMIKLTLVSRESYGSIWLR